MRKSKYIGHIVLGNSETFDKIYFLVGALNLNLMEYQSNAKVRDVFTVAHNCHGNMKKKHC